jgi:hypothetical protein
MLGIPQQPADARVPHHSDRVYGRRSTECRDGLGGIPFFRLASKENSDSSTSKVHSQVVGRSAHHVGTD